MKKNIRKILIGTHGQFAKHEFDVRIPAPKRTVRFLDASGNPLFDVSVEADKLRINAIGAMTISPHVSNEIDISLIS